MQHIAQINRRHEWHTWNSRMIEAAETRNVQPHTFDHAFEFTGYKISSGYLHGSESFAGKLCGYVFVHAEKPDENLIFKTNITGEIIEVLNAPPGTELLGSEIAFRIGQIEFA